jgi:hypothetical protein
VYFIHFALTALLAVFGGLVRTLMERFSAPLVERIDSFLDSADLCPNTAPNEIVDGNGCSILQL